MNQKMVDYNIYYNVDDGNYTHSDSGDTHSANANNSHIENEELEEVNQNVNPNNNLNLLYSDQINNANIDVNIQNNTGLVNYSHYLQYLQGNNSDYFDYESNGNFVTAAEDIALPESYLQMADFIISNSIEKSQDGKSGEANYETEINLLDLETNYESEFDLIQPTEKIENQQDGQNAKTGQSKFFKILEEKADKI